MANVSWTGAGAANRSPEELDCAIAGGTWDNIAKRCILPFAPIEPVIPVNPPIGGGSVQQTGTIDPDQMFADGFVYINGRWVLADSRDAIDYANQQSGTGRPPGMSSVMPMSFVQGGSVLGVQVPVAPAVLLPSYVDGRIGRLELASGLRPESGGTERWIMGDAPRLVLG